MGWLVYVVYGLGGTTLLLVLLASYLIRKEPTEDPGIKAANRGLLYLVPVMVLTLLAILRLNTRDPFDLIFTLQMIGMVGLFVAYWLDPVRRSLHAAAQMALRQPSGDPRREKVRREMLKHQRFIKFGVWPVGMTLFGLSFIAIAVLPVSVRAAILNTPPEKDVPLLNWIFAGWGVLSLAGALFLARWAKRRGREEYPEL